MSFLLLVIIVAALVLGYLTGLGDSRRLRPASSEWWDGWQVGRDLGMRAQRLGAGRNDD